jgi:hypothetical protein
LPKCLKGALHLAEMILKEILIKFEKILSWDGGSSENLRGLEEM